MKHFGLRDYPLPFKGVLSPLHDGQRQRPGDGVQSGQRCAGERCPLPGRGQQDTDQGKDAADRRPRKRGPAGPPEANIPEAEEMRRATLADPDKGTSGICRSGRVNSVMYDSPFPSPPLAA